MSEFDTASEQGDLAWAQAAGLDLGTGGAGGAKASFTVAQAAAALTREHVSWAGANPAAPTTLTYSFMGSAPATMPEDAGGFAPFNATQVRAAELALQAWSDVANIHFDRIGGAPGSTVYSNAGAIRFAGFTTGVAGAAAFTYLPAARPDASAASLQGDGWYNSAASSVAAPKMFQGGQQVFTHEVGHALGLDHPSEYNAVGTAAITYANNAGYAQDSSQYSIMSYFSERSTGADYHGAAPATPLLHDIAAIQALYGANPTAFLGDTVYGFHSTADRPWFSAATATSPLVFSVWDAGGVDTFDFSGYAQAQQIDLNAGQFSNVGGLTANVSIAVGAVIENAIGGSGADQIVGNLAANDLRGMDGDDVLVGDGGRDTLNGNAGADTLWGGDDADIALGGAGADMIVGGAGNDSLNGNAGADIVYGGAGADTLHGGKDDDFLVGEEGDDVVVGDVGADTLFGGAGADRFVFAADSGRDLIADFHGEDGDRIVLDAGVSFAISGSATFSHLDLGGGNAIDLVGVSSAALAGWVVYA